MTYEKLRELIDKFRNKEPCEYHEDTEILEEELKNKSLITWHKYPDEKPDVDVSLLVFDGMDVMQGYFSVYHTNKGDNEEFLMGDYFRSNTVVHFENQIKYWAYMPDGPK